MTHVEDRYGPYLDMSLVERLKNAQNFAELHGIVHHILLSEGTTKVREYKRRVRTLVASILHVEPDLGKMFRYDYLKFVLDNMDVSDMLTLCTKVGLIIPPKVRQRGKKSIILRIMNKYHGSERVRANFDAILRANTFAGVPFLAEENLSFEEFVKRAEDHFAGSDESSPEKFALRLYTLSMTIPNEKYASFAVRLFKAETWQSFEYLVTRAFTTYEWYVMDEKSKTSSMDLEEVLKEQARLKDELKRKEKVHASLRSELHEKSKKEKELKNRIHELNTQIARQLEDALAEIQRLESLLEEQRNYYEEEMRKMAEEYEEKISRLRNELRQMKATQGEENVQNARPLDGVHVLVIGHPKKKSEYKSIVERYGGTFEFYPSSPEGSRLSGVEGPAKRADVIFYLASFTSHKMQEKLEATVPLGKIKFLYSSGTEYFEDRLLEYAYGEVRDAG